MVSEPNPKERRIVGRCLLEMAVLIGSVDEIWTDVAAYRALETLRMCVDAIRLLVNGKHAVKSSFVKSVVIQTNDLGGTPYCLDEVAEFIMTDGEARAYWDTQVPDELHPSKCPLCGAYAYVGLNEIDCKAGCRG